MSTPRPTFRVLFGALVLLGLSWAVPAQAAVKLWTGSTHAGISTAGLELRAEQGLKSAPRYRCSLAPQAQAQPRHAFQVPHLIQANDLARDLQLLNTERWDLKSKLALVANVTHLAPLLRSARPLRSYQRRLNTGQSRQWSIRPPPFPSL